MKWLTSLCLLFSLVLFTVGCGPEGTAPVIDDEAPTTVTPDETPTIDEEMPRDDLYEQPAEPAPDDFDSPAPDDFDSPAPDDFDAPAPVEPEPAPADPADDIELDTTFDSEDN